VTIALVAVVLVGGYLAGTAYVAPGTTTEAQVTDTWSRTSSFSHTATVERATGPFDRGRELSNRSVYFTRAAPVLDIRYAAGYAATDDGSLDATVRLRLVRRARTGDGGVGDTGGEAVLWQTERPLATRNVSGLAPGRTVTVPVSLNVSAVAARTDELVSQLGASPGTIDVAIVADVQFDGRVNGQPETHSFTREVGLAIEGTTYRVTGQPDATTQVDETTTLVERERTYGPAYRIGGPVLLGLGLVGLAAVAVGRARGAFDIGPTERNWLAYRDERSTYDEWIHTVALPPAADGLPRARAESLGDLVDLAIDVEAAVLESPDGGAFHVVHDGYRYVYEAPPRPDTWTWRDGDRDRDGGRGGDVSTNEGGIGRVPRSEDGRGDDGQPSAGSRETDDNHGAVTDADPGSEDDAPGSETAPPDGPIRPAEPAGSNDDAGDTADEPSWHDLRDGHEEE
jgi:hypothetical protein